MNEYDRYLKQIEEEEKINEIACMETAQQNGYSGKAAAMCDNGSLGCVGCPFDYED